MACLQFFTPEIEDADIAAGVGGGEAIRKLRQELIVLGKAFFDCLIYQQRGRELQSESAHDGSQDCDVQGYCDVQEIN